MLKWDRSCFAEEGLFDFRIYGPTGKVFDTKVLGIQIDTAKVEIIGFKKRKKLRFNQWRFYD
jgi:hypothetical protein